MTEYMNVLSENNFDILEEIIRDKYRKFTSLYWMLKEYSDFITSMKYKSSKHEVLKIELKLSGIKTEDVLLRLQDSIPAGEEQILIWNEKKVIHIEITREESELP